MVKTKKQKKKNREDQNNTIILLNMKNSSTIIAKPARTGFSLSNLVFTAGDFMGHLVDQLSPL